MHYRLLESQVNNGNRKSSHRTKKIRHIVIHTAEMVPDTTEPYTSGHRLSEYGASTSRSASWHCQIDSAGVTWQLPEHTVANHCAGNNSTSLGVELAMRAADWAGPLDPWKKKIYDHLVTLVAGWCLTYDIPAERPHVLFKRTLWRTVNGKKVALRDIADNQHLDPGIYAHADLDPEHRHDPGKDFPWGAFLSDVTDQIAVATVKQIRKERKEPMVPTLKTEDVDFIQHFIDELDNVKARPTSLVYVLRFYRELAKQLGLPGNQPERVAGKLFGMPLPDAPVNDTPDD